MSELLPHGILSEDSDLRAHVAPRVQRVFVFRTKDAVEQLNRKRYSDAEAFQDGYAGVTAKGKLVPWSEIPGIKLIRHSAIEWGKFTRDASTSEKGALAVGVIQKLLSVGMFSLWIMAEESTDRTVQIQGTDIFISGRWRIQVKCDYNAGPKELGGTGNLFLQIAEINPLKRY